MGVKARYTSNVAKVQADVMKQIAAFMEQAAHEGASVVSARSDPHVATVVTAPQETNGLVRVGVFIPRGQFWATMFDKGTLGKRVVPLEQPRRRRMEWQVKRRGKNGKTVEFAARRHAEALARGGITPEYFIVRGKRAAEQRRDELLRAWTSTASPPPPRAA